MSTADHQSDEGDPELSILANAFLWDRKHKTSSRQATLNLIYATINASMAALPIACLKCGIFVYICLLLFITLVSAYSSIMIVHMADEQSKVLKLKSAQSLDPRDSSFEEAASPMQDVQDLSWQAPPSYMEQTSESNSGFGEISNVTVNVPLIRSLQELAGCEEAFGQSGFIGVSIMQLIFSFSLMCISLGFFADTAYNTDLALSPTDRGAFLDSLNPGLTSALDGRGIAVTLAALVLLPLCLLKKSLRSFQWLSNAAVFLIAAATIAAVVSVAARSPSSEIGASDITAWLFPRMQKMMLGDEMREILSSVLVIIFCYAYSQKVFIVYLCLRRRTPKKWTRTVVRANLGVLGLYLIFGVIGSIALQLQDFQITSFNFFNEQQIDVANNRHHLVFCVARVVFAFCLLLSIPMECLTARTTLLRLLRKLSAESSSSCLCSWFRCCSSQSTETEAKEPSSLAPLLGDVSGEGHNPAGRLRGTSSITSTFTDSETRSESLSASISQPPPSHYADPAPAGGVPGNYVSRHHSERPFVQVIVPAQMQETRSAGAHQNPTAHSCLSRSTLLCYFDSDQWVVLAIWCVLFTISLLCKDWLYIAVGAGAFCTSALVFVLPSMIYFQLFKRGLPSDHGRMALCSKLSDSLGLNLVPNRVYMAVLLVIGFTLLLSSATVALVSLVENRRVVTRVS